MFTRHYFEYIKSERWKRKRQEAFAYYGRRCQACNRTPKILHVHHNNYQRLGNELMSDLNILCVDCHREVTKLSRRNRRLGTKVVTELFIKQKRLQQGIG